MPSSVIANFTYDPAAKSLRIKFISGLIYEYKKVPEKIYNTMKDAPSKGIFFNRYIKDKYEFKKLADAS